MAEETVLRGVIEFFGKLGIYDVVLPFLFIFTILYAILDKTKVLGTENDMPKRNINSVVAFSIAFFVVASTRLVALVNEAMANIVILLLLVFSFLLLVGSFFKEGDHVYLEKGVWRSIFMVGLFIGIILIFLNSVKTKSGTWLSVAWSYVVKYWSGQVVGAIVFLLVIIGIMAWVTKSGPKKPESSEGETKP